jgi:hypothetical protein
LARKGGINDFSLMRKRGNVSLGQMHSSGTDQETIGIDHGQKFANYKTQWLAQAQLLSRQKDMVALLAYLQIIGMGREALPYLLRELEIRPNWWFVALQAITSEDPVPEEHYGDLIAMTKDWLELAKQRQWTRAG